MERNSKKYYLGLDIGTNSIGWAVTDEQYKLLRHQGKALWGIRLFEEAHTAEERRQHRTSRRRLERRKQRLELLQSLFAPVINPIDPAFFLRLDESNLYQKDKSSKQRFSLFADSNYTDVQFHRDFRTVYHLRNSMLTAVNPDPRLAYLAIHHIVKYRGHFLIEGESLCAVEDIDMPLANINQWLVDNELPTLSLSCLSEVKQALQNPHLSTRKVELVRLFGVDNPKVKHLVELIAGSVVSSDKLLESVDKADARKIDFNADWDALSPELQEHMGDDYTVVENARLLFDYGRFKRLMGDCAYISQGMVAKYDKHAADLRKLKAVVRRYFTQQDYDAMFKASKDKYSYTSYSGKTKYGGRGAPALTIADKVGKDKVGKGDQEKFYACVKELLQSSAEAMEDVRTQEMLADIESGNFMPKQVSKANAVLPYQCNLAELRAILDNLQQYPAYAFLSEQDTNGIIVRAKIESLLKFRMPYYVGPVNNHSGKYWIVRKEDGKIYPWNIEDMVDCQQTEQAFTLRMTKDCPYIPHQKVLPKCSMLYEEAALLNIINKIRVGDTLLPVALKNKLSEYFATPRANGSVSAKMTRKQLCDWLVKEGAVPVDTSPADIGGIDEEIPIGRRTYATLCKIFGRQVVDEHFDELEEWILWSTVAGPEKSNLRRRIIHNYIDKPWVTEDAVKRFVGLTFNGWGQYSRSLLTSRLGTDLDTGEVQCVSVLQMLRSTNCNLSELLKGRQYGFLDAIEALREAPDGAITYHTVEELYCSPAVKKQIWQAMQVVQEIKKVVGDSPLKVFVEMARGEDPKEAQKLERARNLKRKQTLIQALNQLGKERKEVSAERMQTLDKLSPKELQHNKLYLYFMQNGLDAYTGEPIEYNNLSAYDRDHIYPQSKIKDDSILDNMVLTSHQQNLRKADIYPLSGEVQARMRPVWEAWLRAGLITKEKFYRLTRTTPLTGDESADFINRQLVETHQSTKEVCRLLRQQFPDSEIVYSKARLVSEFRQGVAYARDAQGHECKEAFVKVRDINDLHHAKDAYLNIVVGNVYNTRFGHDARVYFAQHDIDHVALDKLYLRDTRGAWSTGVEGTIAQVRKVMANNAILFTRECREAHGIFNKVGMLAKGNGSAPLKAGAEGKRAAMADIGKYGGYTAEVRRYYMLVQHQKKGKNFYTLVGVQGRLADGLTDDNSRRAYCAQQGYDNPVVLIDNIKVNTMFEMDGLPMCLSGLTGSSISWKLGKQCGYSPEHERYLKKVFNVVEKNKIDKGYILDDEDGIDEQCNLDMYDHYTALVSSAPYSAISPLRTFAENLLKLRDKFISLSAKEQCLVLAEIAGEFKCDAGRCNLTLIGGGSQAGTLFMNATYSSLENMYIVHRSVTGIFEQKIPLVQFIGKQ